MAYDKQARLLGNVSTKHPMFLLRIALSDILL